jgi:isopentenyl diphosphate isomerase/L-lactate dehydrogenase-like FMN-dependent dehydrogenase
MSNRRDERRRMMHGNTRKNSSKRRNRQSHPHHSEIKYLKVNTNGMKHRDVHDISLHTAKQYIVEDVRDAKSDGKNGVHVIHGHNSGTTIRDWMRNGPLQQALEDRKIVHSIVAVGAGSTAIILA